MTRVHKKGIVKLTSLFLRDSLANILLEELFLKKNEIFLTIAWIVWNSSKTYTEKWKTKPKLLKNDS